MSRVCDILAKKGHRVVTIGADASVLEAACLMNDHKIGGVLVLENGAIVGMFTERDILRRVVAERRDPRDTLVREVMSTEIVVCEPETPIDEARSVMMHRRIRHLPVVGPDANLVGLVSIGDLNAWEIDGQAQTIHYLEEYLFGRV